MDAALGRTSPTHEKDKKTAYHENILWAAHQYEGSSCSISN